MDDQQIRDYDKADFVMVHSYQETDDFKKTLAITKQLKDSNKIDQLYDESLKAIHDYANKAHALCSTFFILFKRNADTSPIERIASEAMSLAKVIIESGKSQIKPSTDRANNVQFKPKATKR